MKLIECPGGIGVFLTNQEHKLWKALAEEQCSTDLSERDQYLAQCLVSKGVAKRIIKEGKRYFSRIIGSL
tara:strand:- start:367 stop:576 length:210 start_codon:yes stop_codon:yes gene_type:complete